jgi:hypothetical protein
MKSITKRRLKTRSIGRNTLNRQHKRRHSNRRWNAKQDKSRKKRMIGGAFDKYKGGGGLSGMFKRRGWKCECDIHPPSDTDTNTDTDTVTGELTMGESVRDFTVHPPDSSTTTSTFVRSARRVESQAGKFLTDGDFQLSYANKTKTPTIIIRTNRGAGTLPESLENGNFIKKVENTNIEVKTLDAFYKILDENNFYNKPVVLTVERGNAGGSGPREFKVLVKLMKDMPRQGSGGGGGKKTTYRRKKHVTRRKINTKRMKVMVGGTDVTKQVICECTKEIKEKKQLEAGESVSEGEGDDEANNDGKGEIL